MDILTRTKNKIFKWLLQRVHETEKRVMRPRPALKGFTVL